MTEEALNPLRRLYRKRLAQYGWARRVKPYAVRVVQNSQMWYGRLEWLLVLPWERAYAGLTRALLNVGGDWSLRASNWLERRHAGQLSFHMRSFNDFLARDPQAGRCLIPAERVSIELPTVHSFSEEARMRSGTWLFDAPAVHRIELPRATLMGKSDFVFTERECLHHDEYHFDRDLCAEEMQGMVNLHLRRRLVVRRRLPARFGRDLELQGHAVSLLGSSSLNYVHWLTETAPKLALVDADASFDGASLVLDTDLHPNIMASVRLLNTRGRPIVTVRPGQLCTADRVTVLSPVAYVPFDWRPGFDVRREKDPRWAMFVPAAARLLRERLVPDGEGARTVGRRLFLRRKTAARQMRNAEEVEQYIREAGLEIVEPEQLSFEEQVTLFSEAELVVGQAGAAFGNLMFAPPGCRAVIISAWSHHSIYYYFSNLAALLGQYCTFVLCEPARAENNHPAHEDLVVDVGLLCRALQA